MATKNTGGPAFPLLELDQATGQTHAQHMGITRRDYFAAAAMPALIAMVWSSMQNGGNGADWAAVAEVSYGVADAMLAERAK